MKEKTSGSDAGLYQAIIDSYLETGSVLKTSRTLSVSEVKVRRVLLTEGLWSSRTSLQVQHYYNQNMTASQIARLLHTTEKAVQQYMPYERGMYNKEDRTTDAQHSAIYRERMRRAKEKALKKAARMAEEEGWKEMNSEYTQRDLSMERKTCVLHMELSHWDQPAPEQEFENEAEKQEYEEYQRAAAAYREDTAGEELRVLRTYGKLKYDKTITRDVIVPVEMPLYAVHYTIQRAFGWQNSHLHRFSLPQDRFLRITGGKAVRWLDLVGVLFPSPLMDDEDRFWADDYERGSFRNWLRRKYTGPYQSLNHHEGIVQCSMDRKYILQRWPELKEKSIRDVFLMFEEEPNQLLERLPIGQVLAVSDEERKGEPDLADAFEDFLNDSLKAEIAQILKSGKDEPDIQPVVQCCTDVLLYEYDFGDGWLVKITADRDCGRQIRNGRTDADAAEKAVQTVCEENRPVCIAADGLPVLDDVGGLDGYIRFLRGINKQSEWAYWAGKVAEEGGSREEIPERIPDNWDYDGGDTLEWARSLGWTGRMNRPEKML